MRKVRTEVPDIGELGPFVRCTREQRAQLRRLLTPIPMAAGEVLIECGSPPREFGFIADGEVVVERARRHRAGRARAGCDRR